MIDDRYDGVEAGVQPRFESWGDEPMASAVAQACNGGLGAVPPVGSRDKAPGQGSGGRSITDIQGAIDFDCRSQSHLVGQ